MDAARYRDLRRRARQLSRRPADAEDLLQDALLAALESGRDDPAWLDGVMRRQAALAGRTAARRRAREQQQDPAPSTGPDEIPAAPQPQPLLRALPPAARRVAVLALHGLDLAEIQWILAIAPTALRQRLSRIRRALGELPPALRADALALAYVRDPARAADLQFGLVRRALKAALAGRDGLGTHDADGHLLVIRGAHASAPRGNEP
ncbi:MAG: sigma-70 region 4 domain-containing protein [Arenimonas sp.]|nr:sigma-70 region 4 domain-containing protein [Arenimonas sp.]MBP6626535.1 sigma-70 region 4 domain-containing protein [Arenimonas sp.]